MKRFSQKFIPLLLLFSSYQLSAQYVFECGTPDGNPSASLSPTTNICSNSSRFDGTYDANYKPDVYDELLTVNYNLHIMQKSDGSDNFQQGNTTHEDYLDDFDHHVNNYHSNVRLPIYEGNTITNGWPVISDTKIRFKRTGIYYHQSDAGWSNNGNDCEGYNFSNFGVNKDCELNIFFLGEDYSVSGCAGTDYTEETNYIIIQPWPEDPTLANDWRQSRVLLHELGHALGVRHAWNTCNQFNDIHCPLSSGGCNPNAGDPDCSNNFMSYATDQNHISPLQAGHMRELLITTWRSKMLDLDYDPSRSITVNSSETWSQARVIHGNLTINSGATLTVECMLRLSPGSLIYVQKGGKLIIDGGHLTTKHNSCGDRDMWKGIYVLGDPTKSQTAPNQGTLIVKNGSIIEFAENAISTSYNGQSSAAGGIIQLEDSEFLNNKRSLEFLPYPNNNISYIDNCIFNYTIDYPLTTTIGHITMWDVRDVDITDCTFNNDKGIQTDGIYTIDAGLTITGSDFSDLHRAVYVTNSGSSLKTLTATGNTFDVVQNGIRVTAVDNINLSGNDLTIGNTLAGAPLAALLVENSTDFQVSGNTVTSTTVSYPIMGTWILNGGSDPNQIDNNTYHNLYYGNYASSKNRNTSTGVGLQYLCNQNTSNRYDFYVTNHSGTANEGIANYQGSFSQPAGNAFTKASTPSGSDFNNQSNWSSTYYYNPTVSTHDPVNIINISRSYSPYSDGCSMMMAAFFAPQNDGELNSSVSAYQTGKQQEASYRSQYEKNPSDELAAEVARYARENQQRLKQILFYILQKGPGNEENVRSWLEQKGSLYGHFQVADLLVQNRKGQAALNYLNKAAALDITEKDQEELHTFIDLKKLLHQWQTSGKGLDALIPKEVLELQAIADRYNGRGSAQAQSILNFWYGYTYLPEYEGELGEAAAKLLPAPANSHLNTIDFQVAPNPARDLLTISYKTDMDNDQPVVITLMDIFGKQLRQLSLPSGSGTATLDVSDLPDGLYVSSFYRNGVLIKSVKVIVKD